MRSPYAYTAAHYLFLFVVFFVIHRLALPTLLVSLGSHRCRYIYYQRAKAMGIEEKVFFFFVLSSSHSKCCKYIRYLYYL